MPPRAEARRGEPTNSRCSTVRSNQRLRRLRRRQCGRRRRKQAGESNSTVVDGDGMKLTRSGGRGSGGKRRTRVAGGKVVARLLYFESQRQDDHTQDERKDATEAPTKALFRYTPAARAKRTPKKGSLLLAAHEHLETMDSGAAAAVEVPACWRPLGPFSVPHGQTYGAGIGSRPSISGRVCGIAVDPADAAHILICAAGGGVWESRDTGATWAPRTDDQPSLSMGAIAFTPSNPAVVYAGTGEGDSTFVDSPNLLGVGL